MLDCRTAGEAAKCSISHTFRDGQRRAPLVSQDIKTDAAVGVDVRVVDARGEVDLWRLEGVVCGEVDR